MNKAICDTKYPIMLIHGIGYVDGEKIGYWGRIPEVLRAHGATVFFGEQSAFGKIADNARQLRGHLDAILAGTGAEKVNLIAHSKGGLDARYLISCLDRADKVASLTTLCTPHHGVPGIDAFREENPHLLNTFLTLFGTVVYVGGKQWPKGLSVYDQMSVDHAEIFNEFVKDADGVYYQSYACDMVRAETDPVFSLFYHINYEKFGENDGLMPTSAAAWGNFRGAYKGPDGTGISHSLVCDARVGDARDPEQKLPGFYVDMVADLKARGF